MQHVQQTGTTQATSKVSTIDLLQAIKDLNERPDYASEKGATINPLKQLLSFRHHSGTVDYSCIMHAREKAMTAGLVSKTNYRHSLTEAGEAHLRELTSQEGCMSTHDDTQSLATTADV